MCGYLFTIRLKVKATWVHAKAHIGRCRSKLSMSDAKLSLIMNGKQKPGVDFLKAIHTQ
jgi:hypothetical protein